MKTKRQITFIEIESNIKSLHDRYYREKKDQIKGHDWQMAMYDLAFDLITENAPFSERPDTYIDDFIKHLNKFNKQYKFNKETMVYDKIK